MTATGALIMAFFATIWWVVGLRAADCGPALLYPTPVVVAVTLAGIWRNRTRQPDLAPHAVAEGEEARRGRLVGWASAAEGLGIFVAAIVLANTGHRDAIAPVVAIIVGAHFVPLARGLPAPAYYATAGALSGLGIAGLFISDVPTRLRIVSAGAAAVLWLTALSALHRARGSGTTPLG